MKNNENTLTAANLRLYIAHEDYEAAKFLADKGFYRAANDRAFFSMYHAARALVSFVSVGINGTSSVKEYVAEEFIERGSLDPGVIRLYKIGLKARDNADYNDYYIFTKEETLRNIKNAGVFIEALRNYTARKAVLETADTKPMKAASEE
jgi:hypothetical protein